METVKLELEVPKKDYDKELESFLDYTLNYSDIFSTHCIGYWGRGIRVETEETDYKHWLIHEYDDDDAYENFRNVDYDSIIKDYLEGKEIPENFHVLDKELATKAFNELLKRVYKKGRSLQSLDYDADDEDVAIQYAVFGKLVYG